ncbi:hypothetical protein AVEN_224502-1 [Araneus ventricosus]|uniref:Uncharacterized protein n=1 Tax=Araneus ventricosus TaxID=182803 RepID=A0A4Y2L552_ARAVE|nr:hypothetical protein AVEN_224502-1 [Araneus ventricosus]
MERFQVLTGKNDSSPNNMLQQCGTNQKINHQPAILVLKKGNSGKYKHKVHNPNLPSAMRPVPHSEELPVPRPSVHLVVEDESKAAMEVECEEQDYPTFGTGISSSDPYLLTQGDLNDLV